MKTKNFIIMILVFFVSGILSCEDLFDNDDDEREQISEEIIDEKGGTLSSDDFELVVPQGALSGSNTVSLSIDTDYKAFSEGQVSSVFFVDGLPTEINKPIKLKIKYAGSLNQKSFIGIGADYNVQSLNENTESYMLIEARDSADFLIAEFSAPSLQKSTKNTKDDPSTIAIFAITNYLTHSSAHFKINYPSALIMNNNDPVENLAKALEFAYDTLANMGLSYSKRTSWPVEVTIKKLPSSVYGYSTRYFPWTRNCGVLEFNVERMNETTEIATTAGHEFFHLVQDLYSTSDNYDWLKEATSVWFEQIMAKNTAYVSPIRAGHESTPFDGMNPAAGVSEAHHGYGMSALIKYIVEKQGIAFIANLYNEIAKGRTPGDAIRYAQTDIMDLWWDNFYADYIGAKIYSNISVLNFSTGADVKTFDIDEQSDTLKIYTGTIKDLSGKFFVVKPTYDNFQEGEGLEITVANNNQSIAVFSYKGGGSINLVAKAYEKVFVPNLKQLAADKNYLLVLLTNTKATAPNYGNESDFTLKMNVINGGFDLSFVTKVHVAYFIFHDQPTNENGTPYHSKFTTNWSGFTIEGKFFGNTFSASKVIPMSDTWYATTNIGANITVDPDKRTIKTLSYYENSVDSEGLTSSANLSVRDLPITLSHAGREMIFDAEGKNVCKYVASFSSAFTNPYGDGNYSGAICDEGYEYISGNKTSISIMFY